MPGLLRGVARTAVVAGTATRGLEPRVAPSGGPVVPTGAAGVSATGLSRAVGGSVTGG